MGTYDELCAQENELPGVLPAKPVAGRPLDAKELLAAATLYEYQKAGTITPEGEQVLGWLRLRAGIVQAQPPVEPNASEAARPAFERKPSTVWIYALRDPETKAIRYVGASQNPRSRLVGHLDNSLRLSAKQKQLGEWIRTLSARGLVPTMEILEEVPVQMRGRDVQDDRDAKAEQRWIDQLRADGARLFNVARATGIRDLDAERPRLR